MPPKKGKEVEPPKQLALLGRAKNSLSMGIVGLPNIGKSLLFSLLTNVQVPSENYPFCTINPNTARAAIPDKRYEWLCQHYKPKSCVPTYLDCVDIAGLIKGASEGKGLGNAFLSNIKACDGIYHIIRSFDDSEVVHVENDVDPVRDFHTITDELIAKDLQIIDDLVATTRQRVSKGADMQVVKQLKEELPFYERIQVLLQEKKNLYDQDYSIFEVKILNQLQLLSCKPVVFLINMSEKEYSTQKSKWFLKIQEAIKSRYPAANIIAFCAILEKKLQEMQTQEEKDEYLKSLGEKVKSSLNKIIKTGYSELNLVHFFTCGEDEVRAWTIRKYTKAPDAAGTIHTDFHDFFICAEIFKYDDLKELGSDAAVKAEGKILTCGKEHIVEDGDICYFKHNAKGGAAKKK